MLNLLFQDLSITDPDQSSAPVTINAHKGELACIAINQQGTLIATASQKVSQHLEIAFILCENHDSLIQGTLIRVFDASTRKFLGEYRRGADHATLYW